MKPGFIGLEILDPSVAKYRIYSSTLKQAGTGMPGAEGPVCFPMQRWACQAICCAGTFRTTV